MKPLKLGLVLVAVMLASVGVASAQQQVVKVGYYPFGAPLNSLPGATTDNYRTTDPSGAKAQGAMIDLMNAVAKDAGFQVQYVASATGDTVADINAHAFDMRIYASSTPPSPTTPLFDFGVPIFNNGDSLVVLKTDTKPYTSWEDFKGEVVGIQKNTGEDGPAQASGLFKEVKVYPDGNALNRAVSTGEIKAALGSSAVSAFYNNDPKTGSPDNVALGLRAVATYKTRFPAVSNVAVPKGNPQLLAKVNASVMKLKADGTIKAIFAKYGIDNLLIN